MVSSLDSSSNGYLIGCWILVIDVVIGLVGPFVLIG